MLQNTAGRNSDSPSFTIPILLNTAALVLILISQTCFRRTFNAQKIELLLQTEVALGIIPLVFISVVLILTFVIQRWAQVRLKCLWRPVAVSACLLVVGQHIIGIWLALLPVGPVDLSFRLPSSSSAFHDPTCKGMSGCIFAAKFGHWTEIYRVNHSGMRDRNHGIH